MPTAKELQDEGIKLYMRHDYEAASRKFQEAQDAYEAAGQEDMVAEMNVNIGLVHRALNENQQALELMQEALRTFDSMDDKLRTAQVLGNLGGVYSAINDTEQALLSYRQAANLFEELGEKQMYSDTMLAIGNLQVRKGQYLAGAAAYQVGLEDRQNLTFRQKILRWLSSLIARIGGR